MLSDVFLFQDFILKIDFYFLSLIFTWIEEGNGSIRDYCHLGHERRWRKLVKQRRKWFNPKIIFLTVAKYTIKVFLAEQ